MRAWKTSELLELVNQPAVQQATWTIGSRFRAGAKVSESAEWREGLTRELLMTVFSGRRAAQINEVQPVVEIAPQALRAALDGLFQEGSVAAARPKAGERRAGQPEFARWVWVDGCV